MDSNHKFTLDKISIEILGYIKDLKVTLEHRNLALEKYVELQIDSEKNHAFLLKLHKIIGEFVKVELELKEKIKKLEYDLEWSHLLSD